MNVLAFGPFDVSIYVSLALLFGIAAQFRAMDGYSFLRNVLSHVEPRTGILYAVSLVTLVVSPFILNDVLVLILTPALIRYAKQYGLDPAPLVVAEVTFTNIASSLTPIGNPQNIILWASSGIGFHRFVGGTWEFVLASAAVAAAALAPLAWRLGGPRDATARLKSAAPAAYLLFVTAVVLAAEVFHVPDYASLGVGFLSGFAINRRTLGSVKKEFDVRSVLLLYGFITVIAVAVHFVAPEIAAYVAPAAAGKEPYSWAFVGVMSSLIGNVPVTQLLVSTSGVTAAAAPKIAVEAGLAGNLGPAASFANLLALQMAAREGVPLKKAIALQMVVGLVAYLPVLL